LSEVGTRAIFKLWSRDGGSQTAGSPCVADLGNYILPTVRIVVVLLVSTALSACESQSPDVANVRGAADVMEESGPFAVEMILDLEMPESLTSVESTIHGRIDLSAGRSTFEGRSDDGDAWTELVVDGVAYHSRGEIVNAPDWCAIPLSDFEGNALIQTGPLFGDVPDLLRSVSDASVVPDRSTPDSTAYRVTVPLEETPSGALVEGNEATLWLDDAGRLARAEFAFSFPLAVPSDRAVGHARWVLSDWGDADVEVTPPLDDEVERFPDCSF